MANEIQVYTIVNSLAEQSLGLKDLTPTNASFVAVGDTVLKSDENKEAFYKALTQLIGRTTIEVIMFKHKSRLRREGIDYGLALRKIRIGLPKAIQNDSYITDSAKDPFELFKADVEQSIFSSFTTWSTPLTVPESLLLKTAFKDAASMGAFIEGHLTAMETSMELSIANMENLCRCSYIARKYKAGNLKAINLLSEYNALQGNTVLTPTKALQDRNFLLYASSRISLFIPRFKKPSKLFNSGEMPNVSRDNSICLDVLADFASACKYYLQSDIYNKDLVALPKYEEIPYWQGTGKDYGFTSTGKVTVELGDKDEDGEEITTTVTGVLAVMYDDKAMGVTVENMRTPSIYNPRQEYFNYFPKADIGFYNDMDENGMIFYIA